MGKKRPFASIWLTLGNEEEEAILGYPFLESLASKSQLENGDK